MAPGRPATRPHGSGDAEASGRWRLRNWRLRAKLLAVLLVPSFTAVVLGSIQVIGDMDEADNLNHNSIQVQLDSAATSLVHELQRERDLTVDYIASGRTGSVAELQGQRGAVDRALNAFRAKVEEPKDETHLGHDDSFQTEVKRFEAAAEHLNRLGSLRQVADSSAYPADAAMRTYTDSIDNLLDLGEQGLTSFTDPELVRGYLATNALARLKEQESVKRALLAEALRVGGLEKAEEREFLAADAQRDAALAEFQKWGTVEQIQSFDDTVTGPLVDKSRNVEETVLVRSADGESMGGLTSVEWLESSTETVKLTSKVEQSLRAELQTAVDDHAGNATARMYIGAALVIAALVLAAVIALVIARSLLRPLRTLRRTALSVAEYRLPHAVESILTETDPDVVHRTRIEPVPVHTREEVGQVARSFDAVHEQALRLASQQALLRTNVNDLFVNLARRSQTLVQRQLALIDQLEQDEQDPDQLSQLFELDHLATRMRRNNENLLILGGTDLTRRMMKPVALSEVVGAAVSEVEQYARVTVGESPDLAVQGRVVNDLVHLVAELLENATVFSNPDTEVSIRTAYRSQELVIEIQDRGVGIDDDELFEINNRLTRAPEVDVAVSRRMGLFVVSQLSHRHNIRVALHNNSDLEGGVTATVHVSGEYISQLTENGPVPMTDAPRSSGQGSVTETGTHVGLAAAFGGGGGAFDSSSPTQTSLSGFGSAESEAPTQFTSMPEISGQDSPGNGHYADSFPEADDQDSADQYDEYAEVGDGGDHPDDAHGTQYSVQISSGEAFGATEIPKWDTEEAEESYPQAAWPYEERRVEQSGPVFDGQCGPPSSTETTETTNALFQSHYETARPDSFEGMPVNGTDTYDRSDAYDRSDEGDRSDVFDRSEEGDRSDHGGIADRGERAEAVNGADSALPVRTPGTHGVDGDRALPPLGASAPPPHEMDDAPTQRLPIYEAVLSQWFRESESESSVETSDVHHDGFDLRTPGNGVTANGAALASDSERTAVTVTDTTAADQDVVEESRPAEEEPAPSRHVLAPTQQEDPGWGLADEGWQAAEALVQQTKAAEQTTTPAGLPKRVPKSNLMPGSVASRPQQATAPRKPAAPRSADAVRGRMSNFQQGVRRGRHAKAEPVSSEPSRSNPSRPEEQE